MTRAALHVNRVFVVAVVLAAVAAPAVAGSPRPGIELGAGTAIPLAVDVEATIAPTDQLGIELAVGVMPPPYIDLINATVVAFDGYDEATAELIAAALDKAVLTRISIAYRPFRFPLAFHAGYSFAALGGGLGSGVAVEAVTGQEVTADAGNELPISSTLHLLQVGASWRFTLPHDLVLRVSLEYTQPVASSTSIDASARTAAGMQRIDRVNDALDEYMNDTYTSYVKAPVIGVSLRYKLR